jgi:hypothetical protein
VWGQLSAPVHLARHAVGALFANCDPFLGASRLAVALKLFIWVADNFFVRRSALITGLSLALTGATLAGIGEWVAGRLGK